MEHKCSKEDVICTLSDDVKEIKSDVKQLLDFKTRVLTGLAIFSFFSTIIVNYIVKHLNF